jgi:SAM-dependent methyltransferase
MTEESRLFEHYEESYQSLGHAAQRRYPNEELCRFMGRNYFPVPYEKRQDIRILETGCGSGANLWMIAREGFDAVGIDLSPAAIKLCEQTLNSYQTSAELHVGDMTKLPLVDQSVDVVVDIFSSNCLDHKTGIAFIRDVWRVLKQGGRFFSYFPSKRSDAWTDPLAKGRDEPAFIDEHTLNGISRESSPFIGNDYPFRFLHPREYIAFLTDHGFAVSYCETVKRTYHDRQEVFEFVTVEGVKA